MKNNPTIWLSYVSFPITTAVYFENALRKKHNVITCGPKLPEQIVKQWQLEDIKAKSKDLDVNTNFGDWDFKTVLNSIPKNAIPDLFLWVESAAGYFPLNIKGNGFPTACYLIDSHLSLSRHLQWAKNFDYVFIAQREYIPDFKKAGIENVYWLPLGADPEVHSPKNVQKIYDVGFVGSVNSEFHKRRSELLQKINSVVKVSYKRCWLDEMAEFFSASKIVFNNAIRNDLNMRLFEAMSTGSFLLTDIALNSGQDEMFKDGEDLGIYSDENIIDKVKYYLDHEAVREKIAYRGRQIIQEAHTYSHRVDEILNVCLGKTKTTPTAEEWRSRSTGKISVPVNAGLDSSRSTIENKRSFVIPVLDMSPASPYNIVKLLDNLKDIPGDVIIIFNSLEMAEKLKDHPRIDYYASMKMNVGVSRAWNIGLNISQTPVTFILNSDLHISKETIEQMEKYLLRLPDAAIVGPQGSFFNFETAKDMFYLEKGKFNDPMVVDAVSGFLFAVKTELFNSSVIKFDNQYTPCYFEEWDLGLQIKQNDLKSYAVPVNGFEHEWSGSIRALRTIQYFNKQETSNEILERNRKLFWTKWKGINYLEGDDSVLLESYLKDLLLKQAEEFINQDKISDAENVLKELSGQYPKDKEILEKLGLLIYKANRLEEALEVFERIRELDPDYQIHTGEVTPDAENASRNDGLMRIKENEYYNNKRPDIQAIVAPSARTILDVGCGAGAMASELKEKLSAEVWGIEYYYEAAESAAKILDNVIAGSVEDSINDLPNNYFDSIIFADVLEHLVDPYTVLNEIKHKLAPDGEIIASIPNVRHWSVVKELLEGNWEYKKWGIMDSTHLRFFTRQSIFKMFDNAGLQITNLMCNVIEMSGLTPHLISAMREADMNVDTLEGESKHFQYILKAKNK